MWRMVRLMWNRWGGGWEGRGWRCEVWGNRVLVVGFVVVMK